MRSVTPQPVRPTPRAIVAVLRRNPDMRRLYFSQLISFGGDWFLVVALQGLILELSDSNALAGLMFSLLILPSAFVAPFAGVLADRVDRRMIMIASDVVRAGLALSMLFARDLQTLWIAFVAQALMTVIASFFHPAAGAALPNLVRDIDDLPIATAIQSSAWGTMLMLGAALGGFFTAVAGRDAAFIVDAASFLLSAWFLMRTTTAFQQVRVPRTSSVKVEIREGARIARRDLRINRLLVGKGIFGLTAGSVALIAVMSEREFAGGAALTGVLFAARGVGAAPGPFLFQHVFGIDDFGLRRGISAAFGLFSLGYLIFALAPNPAVAFVAVAIAHLGGGAHWVLAALGYQRYTQDASRGRIMSIDHMFTSLTFGGSLLLAGLLAERFGPRVVIVGMSCAGFAWAAYCGYLTRIDRQRMQMAAEVG
jgi:MFS family permease